MGQMRRCWRCKNVADLKEMKYDSSGKDLICPECLAKENRGNAKQVEETATDANPIVTNKVQNPSSNEPKTVFNNEKTFKEINTVSYQCGSCSLGFTIQKGGIANSCPYCGKNNIRTAFRDSAQKLIEEAEGKEFDS